jgi:hypothetical protein
MEFRVAVHNYGAIRIKGKGRSAPRMFGVPCGYEWKNKYKDAPKMSIMTMDPSYIWGYVSFGLVLLALMGLVVFTWWALRKIRSHPVM